MSKKLMLNNDRRLRILTYIQETLLIKEHLHELVKAWELIKDPIFEQIDKKYLPEDMKILHKYSKASIARCIDVSFSKFTIVFPFYSPNNLGYNNTNFNPLAYSDHIDGFKIQKRFRARCDACPSFNWYRFEGAIDRLQHLPPLLRILPYQAEITLDTPDVVSYNEIFMGMYREYYRVFEAYYNLIMEFKTFDQVLDVYPMVKDIKHKLYANTPQTDTVDEKSLKLVKEYQTFGDETKKRI